MRKFQTSGFTLIELLVVLAIIGILIALAIVGLRAAQSAQRDTSRKDIASQINAELQGYISNNGCYPLEAGTSCAGENFVGPAGSSFMVSGTYCAGNGVTVNNVCVGLDGLNVPTAPQQQCTAQPSNINITGNVFNMCYSTGVGAAGYEFGVQLESRNGTTGAANWYLISS
jgi:prepilin-type N-terminal cleavage/methylation domain-containing protein